MLGDTVERQLFISIRLYGADWLLHPIVAAILCLALLGILRPVFRSCLTEQRESGARG